MKPDYIDTKFKVISDPRPRSERPDPLPQWFKTLMFALAALFALSGPVWRFNAAHSGAPAEAEQKAAPQPPPAQ